MAPTRPASRDAGLGTPASPEGIAALTFSGDGTRLASASIDHTARIWDATPVQDDRDASGP